MGDRHEGYGGWWPRYSLQPDAEMATVPALVAGVALLACALGFVALALPQARGHVRWGPTWAVVGIAVAVGAMLLVDLRRLVGTGSLRPPVWRAMTEVLAALTGTGLAEYAFGADVGGARFLMILPVMVAGMIGNFSFVAIVWVVAMAEMAVTASAAGTPAADLPVLLLGFGLASMGAAFMLGQVGWGHVRSHRAFGRLIDTMEAILRADGFEEGLQQFMALVAEQTGVSEVQAFRCRDGVATPIGTHPDGGPRWSAVTPAVVDAGSAPGDPAAGFEVDGDRTILYAADGLGDRVVLLAVGRHPPGWRQQAYQVTLGRLTAELGLLVHHRDYLRRLDRLGRTDGLTGLANRRELAERLEVELVGARRRGMPVAVAMIDIDHFKEFNDDFGHLEGDRILVALADLLRQSSRGTDVIARYGGEEFCVVLPGATEADAATLMGHLHDAVRRIPAPRPVTVSVGVAGGDVADDGVALLQAADRALYQAKEQGRDRVQVAHPAG